LETSSLLIVVVVVAVADSGVTAVRLIERQNVADAVQHACETTHATALGQAKLSSIWNSKNSGNHVAERLYEESSLPHHYSAWFKRTAALVAIS
jgi:hypothetical protein